MNGAILLVLIVYMTAAKDLPIITYRSFTSSENSPVESSENDFGGVFRDEDSIEYSTGSNGEQTLNNRIETTGEMQTPPPSESNEIATSKPSNEQTPTEELQATPSSALHRLDFDDWDIINEDDETLFEEFNQTILNEMKAGIFRDAPRSTTQEPTTTEPLRYTDGDTCKCARVRKQKNMQPVTKKDHQCGRILKSRNEMSKKEGMPTFTIEFDEDMFMVDPTSTSTTTAKPTARITVTENTPSTTSGNLRYTPAPIYLDFDYDMYETEKSVAAPTAMPTPQAATPGFDSDEDGNTSDEYLVPVTDEGEDNSEEARNDPCNYERFNHPIPAINKTGKRVSDIKCEEYLWEYKLNVSDVEKNRRICKENMESKNLHPSEIFGGIKAIQRDFPHMGAVGWIKKDGERKWMCGSSLISPRFSLTAAHCSNATEHAVNKFNLRYSEPKVVRFGSVYLEDNANKMKNLNVEDIFIETFLVLDEYAAHPIMKYNDIGLIKLKSAVTFKLFIKPACIRHGFVGSKWSANVTGWGKTTEAEGSESNHLRYAALDFVDKATCRKYIHGRRNRHWPQGLLDHQFCAGKLQGGIDACQGDSGGPIHVTEPVPASMNSSDFYHSIIGVTSFGIKCGYALLPGVYTNVTSFLCWVEKNVWPEEHNEFCP